MTKIYKPDALEMAVWETLHEIGFDTEYANQQESRTNPPFTTLEITTRVRQGQDVRSRTLENGALVYRGMRHGTITLLVVGDDCNERADDLINALQRDSASAAFRKYGPTLHSATPITLGVSNLDGAQFEQATAIDLQYRVAVEHWEDGEYIEAVVVPYLIKDAEGSNTGSGVIAEYLDGQQPPAGSPVVGVGISQILDPIKVGESVPHPAFTTLPRDRSGVLSYEWRSLDDSVATPDTSPPGPIHIRGVAPGETLLELTVDNIDGTKVKTTTPVTVTN